MTRYIKYIVLILFLVSCVPQTVNANSSQDAKYTIEIIDDAFATKFYFVHDNTKKVSCYIVSGYSESGRSIYCMPDWYIYNYKPGESF